MRRTWGSGTAHHTRAGPPSPTLAKARAIESHLLLRALQGAATALRPSLVGRSNLRQQDHLHGRARNRRCHGERPAAARCPRGLRTCADSFGLKLTLFVGCDTFIEQALFWADRPKPDAAIQAALFVETRLLGVESSPAVVERWQELVRQGDAGLTRSA